MAARRSSRVLKPLLYTAGAGAIGSGILYISYRPRDIPGSEAAAVPPPTYGEGGKFRPPHFPRIKTREEQIEDLKRSGGLVSSAVEKARSGISGLLGGAKDNVENVAESEEEPYDLLIIGGGATGAGIALDAATRGLKVAMVERDDFSSGTSSKSTKLVHGGVRYLEKAVWELDYNQYVTNRGMISHFLKQTSGTSSSRKLYANDDTF
jgi:glycerol-3-phosphate dehydrogenase